MSVLVRHQIIQTTSFRSMMLYIHIVIFEHTHTQPTHYSFVQILVDQLKQITIQKKINQLSNKY